MSSETKTVDKPNSELRAGHVLLAIVIGISVVGFLVGVRIEPESMNQQDTQIEHPAKQDIFAGQPRVAVDYGSMAQVRRGPNASWQNTLPEYTDNPTNFYGSQAASPELRKAAIATRSQRRAFSGAPPVVPHAIDERNAQACLACHGSGMKIGTVIAPKMSHHYLANCTQCHVEAAQNFPGAFVDSQATDNSFVGLAEPGEGTRVGPGAPPTIPHALWMRSECSACHGDLGKEGLRSSHPWRTNCTQCHAPSRGFDWAPLEEQLPKRPKAEQQRNTIALDTLR